MLMRLLIRDVAAVIAISAFIFMVGLWSEALHALA